LSEKHKSVDNYWDFIGKAGYFQLLGLHIDEAQDGRGVVSIRVDSRLMHPHQVVHGGVIFTLADTAMSMALMSVLPPYTRLSTIEAKINYLLPVLSGELVAEAALVHRGRSTAVMEATIYNNDGDERRAIARALGTFKIFNSRYTPSQEEESAK
jgi:acyl-CoA thioesterase